MIELKGVGKSYPMGVPGSSGPKEDLWILRDVDLKIEAGEFVAIVGPSGSGKSTLMNILGCLTQPSTGEYHFNGRAVHRMSDDGLADLRNQSIGFIFQQFHLLPRLDVLANTLMPQHYRQLEESELPALRARARDLLVRFGLGDRLTHKPNELSGGQKQKVAITRALLLKPDLILADEPTGNLDSKSTEEILRELTRLHADGHTILLITHDRDVARRAHRIITISDGRIVSDEYSQGGDSAKRTHSQTPVHSTSSSLVRPEPGTQGGATKEGVALEANSEAPVIGALRWFWRSYASDGLQNIARNRARSLLTMLGVIIGTSAVIAMITIGGFARTKILSSFESIGTNQIWVYYNRPPRDMRMKRTPTPLNQASRGAYFQGFDYKNDILKIRDTVPGVDHVSPELQEWSGRVMRKGFRRDDITLSGVNEQYVTMMNYPLAKGRNFFASDIQEGAHVAIIGKRIAEELFGTTNPVGDEIKVARVGRQEATLRLQVIGVLDSIDSGGKNWRDPNDVILLPFTTSLKKLKISSWDRVLGNFIAQATNFREVQAAVDGMKSFLTSRYRSDVKFEIFAREQWLKEIRKMLSIFQSLLGGIAILSLMVGGIGIMNIMLVTVTERTKEIGLRKAIGAQRAHVERLFLTESVLLCLTGGCIGVALGLILSNGLVALTGMIYKNVTFSPVFDLSAVALAFFFSVVVGVIFGVYPARRAARLDPVDALRWE